jgi:hypothetical protein
MKRLAVCILWPVLTLAAGSAAPPADLDARLAALSPGDPEAYYLLAEEVADVAQDPGEFKLARELYALAYELERTRKAGSPLSASACIGLARIERLDQDRRWLNALAGTIDPRYALPDWNVPATPAGADETALKAATVLGMARAGEGGKAAEMLEEPGVLALMQEYERAMGTTGETGAIFRLNRSLRDWPCPECKNRRVVSKQAEGGFESRLCPTCGGNPGPRLSPREVIDQLRFEATLLSGIQRSWAAQIAAEQGAPLRDPEPAELAATYGVDAARPYWRDGAWVAGPAADPAP